MCDTHIAKLWHIEIWGKSYSPCLWKEPEPTWKRIIPIMLWVKIRAVGFFTKISMQTLFHLEIVRMEFLLLPPMAEAAFILKLATILIRSYEIFCMPILTHILWIIENWGLSSVILPVVRIDTDISFMIIFSIRTPYRFEMKDIEIHIWFEFLNQLNREFFFSVCEGTKFTVFTFLLTIEIRWTEFSFVLIWMIKFFNTVVSFITLITIRTFLMIVNVPAFLRLIVSKGSSSIFNIVMIIGAFFKIMIFSRVAGRCLEIIQIQKWDALRHRNILCAVVAILWYLLILELWLSIWDCPPSVM